MKRPALSLLAAAVIALLLVGIGLLPAIERRLPPNSLPWRPVVLDAPPGWIAHWQMYQLKEDGNRCRAALSRAQLAFDPIPDRQIDGDCGYRDAVRLTRTPVRFSSTPTATCALAAALYWYQGLLEKAAMDQMHSPLAGIDHVGIFACRNVNHETDGARSQHATANAIDVTAFRFADGHIATIAHDYGKPTPQGRFLSAAHDAACRVFNGVLGPGYNRLHTTHFHLDMGPYWICR